MEATRLCPQCRQPLAADAPDGLCPQCLMKAAAGPPPSGASEGLAGDMIDIGDPAEVAKKLPQFEILEILGRGGMGVVYKARQRNLDRIVAVKILPPLDALSPDFVARFSREARALARLNHQNIVDVHDCGETGGLYYIVMEYVDGVNLRELLQTRQLTPAEALAIVPKICDALEYAHEQGLVHRDIKPENLLIDKKGRVKIADFGLAKLLRREPLDMTLTLSGMALGTLRYMAPEQMDKPETVDHRADLYSLGVVIYEMLTGEIPVGRFELPSQKAQTDVRLDEIVLHALEKEPARRYQHASEVRDDVEKVTSKPQGAAVSKNDSSAESDAVRRARASWFARRSERFRRLLPPTLVFLELVLILASFAGWPSPWMEWKYTHASQLHGAVESSFAFHPFTFSFSLLVLAGASALLAIWFGRIDTLVRYGRRFRELRKEIRRKAQREIIGCVVAAILLPCLTMSLFAAIYPGGSTSAASTTQMEFRLRPNSKAYEELLIDLPFYSSFGHGVSNYRRPNQWDMAIGLRPKDGGEPARMDIGMPSLHASYRPSWAKDYEVPIVLDLDELTKWMADRGKLDVKDEKVKKEATEVMTLLKQFSRQAPVCFPEYLAAQRELMPDFSNAGSMSKGGTYSAVNGGWLIGIYLTSAVIFLSLYFVVAMRIQRAAFALDREVRERGESILGLGPLPHLRFAALPREIRARTIRRAAAAAVALLLLPGLAALWESAQPKRTKQTYHYQLDSQATSYNKITMSFAFESYERGGETWFVEPHPLRLEIAFTSVKNFVPGTPIVAQHIDPKSGLPEGTTHSFTVELPGLRATSRDNWVDGVTLDAEELERWLRSYFLPWISPQPEDPGIKRDTAELMAFLKTYATQPPSTHEAFLASMHEMHLQMPGGTGGRREYSRKTFAMIIPAFTAAVVIFLALLPLLKRSAVHAALREGTLNLAGQAAEPSSVDHPASKHQESK